MISFISSLMEISFYGGCIFVLMVLYMIWRISK